ncbi:MAG: dienelactone hydrolase family protein [Acidimicrobiales bacterium]|nr:dienelactone hydrolase family protein [Acidimicrobiales bacterium]
MHSTLTSGTPMALAHPANGRRPTRGLVVIPDIGGLRPLFHDLVQRLADDNDWAVAAVEPWPGREHLPLQDRLEQVATIDDGTFLAELVEAADFLGVEPVGITGFCMGGMFTLKAAGTGRFHRAVAFYGMIRVPAHWRGPANIEPLDAVTAPDACPTLAVIGTADTWTPPEDVAMLEAAGVEVARYDGAEHGFVHDPSRPAHRPDDAADAWRRATAFLSG